MTGPFSPSSTIAPPASDAPVATIKGDAFWPELDLGHLRNAIRIDQTVTIDRLRDVARGAMLDIMGELEAWRTEQVAAGYATLANVPGRRMVDDLSDYQVRWIQAVHAVVAADLGDRQLGQSARAAGIERAEELAADVDHHRRNVTFAVRDFLGRPRIIAEAI